MPTKDANAGQLNGTRHYYSNDYMARSGNYLIVVYTDVYFQVRRGPGYVSTLKMYSTRTRNSECTNSQNVSV